MRGYAWLVVPWLVPSRFTSWCPLPWLVLSRRHRAAVSDRHRRHEEQHLRDMRAWLVLYPLVWLALAVAVRFDYRSHAWEVRARIAGAGAVVHVPGWWRVAGVVTTVAVLMLVANRLGLDGTHVAGWLR